MIRRWLKRSPDELPMNPASRLTHHLGYEAAQAVFVALFLGVLAFVALGGQFGDIYVWLRAGAATSGEVSLLTIGEESLYLYDPHDAQPEVTPRGLLAELVRFADAAGARVIVLDILLDQAQPDDPVLAEAARAHGAVIAAERFVVTDPATGREFAAGLAPGFGHDIATGFANLQEEENALFSGGDLLVRRAPLVRRVARARLTGPWPTNVVGGEQTDSEVVPSLALLGAWLHVARGRSEQTDPSTLRRTLAAACGGGALACDLGAEGLGLPRIPGGLARPLEINFRGPESEDGIPTVRAAQALRVMGESALLRALGVEAPIAVPDDLASELRDRIVVVCRVDAGAAQSGDRFATPYAFPALMRADMTGGRIQAQVIDTLLSGRHVRHTGPWLAWPLAALLIAGVWWSQRRLRDDVHSLAWLIAGVALVALGAAVFRVTDGLVLDVGLPLTAMLVAVLVTRVRAWALEDVSPD